MRLTEAKVDALTEQIAASLLNQGNLDVQVPDSRLRVLIRQAMIEELQVEDRLEEEVRQILKQYEYEIRRGRLSYNTLFNRVKSQLVRERNLVL